jgi:hypothetical protein
MNTEFSRFIGGGGDDASFGRVSAPSDDQGTADQFRMPFLLNGSEKSIHVDVKDPSQGLLETGLSSISSIWSIPFLFP